MHRQFAKRGIELDWERYISAVECAYGVDSEDYSICEGYERILWWSQGYDRASEWISRHRYARQQAKRRVDELRDYWEGNLRHESS